MNRNERDWPAVCAAVDGRMKELGLSTAEVARKMNMAENTLRAFLNGRTRPHGYTIGILNDALDLPDDHLRAIAEKRKPRPRPKPPDTRCQQGNSGVGPGRGTAVSRGP